METRNSYWLFFPICSVQLQRYPLCLPILLWCGPGKARIPKLFGTQTDCFSTPVVIVVSECPLFTCLLLIMAIIITPTQILEGTQFTAVCCNTCFFNFSTLYAMKHWFEFKHRLFVLVIIFHIFQLWWGRNQSWHGGRAILYPGFVDQVCDLIQFFGLITVLYLSLRINITWFPSWKKHKA